jgi:hypothetical protein
MTFLLVFFLSFGVIAKDDDSDDIVIVQGLIDEAYRLGYIDAAPVEMDFIEKKVIEAKAARDDRKRKIVEKLIAEIKADLKIVKQRFKVNEMYNKLKALEQANLQSQRTLDDLKRQL